MGRWGDIVLDAVFDLEHVAIHISHTHTLARFVDTQVDKPAFGGVEKGDDFSFKVKVGR